MDIFVVEDSLSVRSLLVRSLATVNRARVVGETALERPAIALIEWLQPDVVTLDLTLADGGSGLRVLSQVRRLGYGGRIFVLSTEPAELYRDRCIQLGADGYYDKASDLEALLAHLSSLTSGTTDPRPAALARDIHLLAEGPTDLLPPSNLPSAVELAVRNAERDETGLAVYVARVDGVKELTGQPGIADVDALLQAIASRLIAFGEGTDCLARHAGHQLALAVVRIGAQESTEAFESRLSAVMAESLEHLGLSALLSAHVAVARYPSDGFTARALLVSAEARSYGPDGRLRVPSVLAC